MSVLSKDTDNVTKNFVYNCQQKLGDWNGVVETEVKLEHDCGERCQTIDKHKKDETTVLHGIRLCRPIPTCAVR